MKFRFIFVHFITDWLSHSNHAENRDQEIMFIFMGMNINIYMFSTTVYIPICMSMEALRAAMNKDTELQRLKNHIIRGRPQTMDEMKPGVEKYGPIRHDLVMTDSTAM